MTERSDKVHYVAKNSMYLKTSCNMTLNSDFTLCPYWGRCPLGKSMLACTSLRKDKQSERRLWTFNEP